MLSEGYRNPDRSKAYFVKRAPGSTKVVTSKPKAESSDCFRSFRTNHVCQNGFVRVLDRPCSSSDLHPIRLRPMNNQLDELCSPIHRVALPAITPSKCTGCGWCVAACPDNLLVLESIAGKKSATLVKPDTCTGCAKCIPVCNFGAIRMVKIRNGETI
jgi:ferredoxin